VVGVKVYVEGGGDTKKQKSTFRKGFVIFIEKAGLKKSMPEITPCGSRNDTFARFKATHAGNNEKVFLLVDAEAPVAEAEPWQHLKERDGWDRPIGAKDEQCHLMVQFMESWFMADREALRSYYKGGFREQALSKNPNIEAILKQDVNNALKSATKDTSKGDYDKGNHSSGILETLDPAKVMSASPYAKRFFDCLRTICYG
jgi:hypothetical protein